MAQCRERLGPVAYLDGSAARCLAAGLQVVVADCQGPDAVDDLWDLWPSFAPF